MENLPQWNCDELLASPLFAPLFAVLQRLERTRFPLLDDFNSLLATQPAIKVHSNKQLRFVEQGIGRLAFESQYEPRCYLNGEVQTRENNLHDLFNALVWLVFPLTKAAINARHYRALTEVVLPLQTQRGRVRDMATLFDESGIVVVCANSELAGLLRDFKWKELFWSRRDEVAAGMGFYLFGHGLYEKAIHPYVGMTGQGLLLPVEDEFFNWPMQRRMQLLDERMATYLNDALHCCDTRELTPVPLLGIPGWSNDNSQAEYYDNKKYFRAGRANAVNGWEEFC